MRALAILILLFAAPAFAQPKTPTDRREQVKKKIRALRAYTLTEELGLDEQTAGKLFPMLARYDDELDKLVGARVDVQKRLAEAGTQTNTHVIDAAIDDALANQRGLRSVEDRRVADFRKILTPQQVARILIVLPALDRKIQNQLQRVIKNSQKGPPRRAPAEIDEDDDEDAPMTPPSQGPAATTGTLDLATTPSARVVIDGAETGRSTPIKGLTLAPGAHKLTLVLNGDRFTYPINVIAGQTLTVRKDLR